MNKGPSPTPAVYRRRRLMAALLVVLVLGLLIWGASALVNAFLGPGAGQNNTEQGQAGSPNDSTHDEREDAGNQPAEDENNGDDNEPEQLCHRGDITLRADTNKEAYAFNEAPLLILEIENTSDSACSIDVGTAEQVFTVTHQGQTIFSTSQCALEGESLVMEFQQGDTERAQLLWPRSNSADSCSEPGEIVHGDYELTVGLGTISSEPVTFVLLERP